MQVSFKYGKAANVKTKSNLCDLCDLCIQELWKIAVIFAIITWSLSACFGHQFQKCLVKKSIRLFLQLNQYETVPYFIQLSKNLTSDWFFLAETEAKPWDSFLKILYLLLPAPNFNTFHKRNIIHWVALGQMNRRPSVWCSK